MELLPLMLFAPVLVAVAYHDIRYMRIPNVLSLIGLGLFVLTAPLVGWEELGLRLLSAAAVFAVGIVVFVMRWFGGGDVKIMTVLMLFIPTSTLSVYGFGFSASMLLGVGFIVTLRSAPWLNGTEWVTIRARGTFPMGISIALSGLLHPFLVNALA